MNIMDFIGLLLVAIASVGFIGGMKLTIKNKEEKESTVLGWVISAISVICYLAVLFLMPVSAAWVAIVQGLSLPCVLMGDVILDAMLDR